ncbi:MAG: ribonuclease H-like domain-containing protein [Candidatus Nanohaloarchaea archaeon]
MRLVNSFVLAPGIGRDKEKRLWEEGFHEWGELEENGVISGSDYDRVDEFLEKARRNLEVGNPHFFHHNLPGDGEWRLYRDFEDEAAFFDIETTGLEHRKNVVTTVSVHRRGETRTLVRGKDLDASTLEEELSTASVLVSFNGKRFDVPFLEKSFGLDIEKPHLDLMYPLRRMGYTGGLKAVEEELGLDRDSDVDGKEAIRLWKRYERDGDESALERLVHYNRLDAVNLRELAEKVHSMMSDRVFRPHV